MLHHVSVGVADVERAAKFYDAVLGALGYKRVAEYLPHAVAYGDPAPRFWVQIPHDREAASVGNGTHFGFNARSARDVDAFYRAALEQGGSDNGPPGPRADYGPDYYGAFVIDLDGNRIEATLYPEPKPAKAARAKAKPKRTKPAKRKANSVVRRAAKTRRPAKRGVKPGRRKAKRR